MRPEAVVTPFNFRFFCTGSTPSISEGSRCTRWRKPLAGISHLDQKTCRLPERMGQRPTASVISLGGPLARNALEASDDLEAVTIMPSLGGLASPRRRDDKTMAFTNILLEHTASSLNRISIARHHKAATELLVALFPCITDRSAGLVSIGCARWPSHRFQPREFFIPASGGNPCLVADVEASL